MCLMFLMHLQERHMTSDCKETWLCIFTEQIENRLEGRKSYDLLRAVGSLVAQTIQEHHLDVFVACVVNPYGLLSQPR